MYSFLLKTFTRQKRSGDTGFTIIEIIAVLMLISVVGGIVLSRIGDNTSEMIARAGMLKTHLRYAQARAMNSDSVWGIRYDSTGNTYRLFEYDKTGTETARYLPGEDAIDIALSAEHLVLSGFNTLISFDAWGRACTDAAGLIQGGASFTVNASGNAVAITVDPETGFIP